MHIDAADAEIQLLETKYGHGRRNLSPSDGLSRPAFFGPNHAGFVDVRNVWASALLYFVTFRVSDLHLVTH